MTEHSNKIETELESEVYELLVEDPLPLPEIKNELVDVDNDEIETAVRRLLKKEVLAETPDWEFYVRTV
jgi:hypothetical protein